MRAVKGAEIVVVSVPSQAFRSVMSELRAKTDMTGKYLVTCMKGIEISTGKRLSEIALEFGLEQWQIAVWAGPGHVQEFVQGNPNCMLIDGYERSTVERIIDIFKSPLIRFYYGTDVIGTEIGAAAKNVMGIVAGVLDGMNLVTLKGALMARGSREVSRLIESLGGNPLSAYGLCHLGDYETTLFSEHSHNRQWGENYVLGKPFKNLADSFFREILDRSLYRTSVFLHIASICQNITEFLYLPSGNMAPSWIESEGLGMILLRSTILT